MRQHVAFLDAAGKGYVSHVYILSGNDVQAKEKFTADLIETLHVQRPDIFTMSETSIAQARALRSFVSMSAWASSHKVGIIAAAHEMNQETQSALLKILEEPRGNSVFVLLAEPVDALLKTIRSRGQELKFYDFVPQDLPAEDEKQFRQLRSSSIQERFAYAKKLSDSPEEVIEVLQSWLYSSRALLIQQLSSDPGKVKSLTHTIKTIQETLNTLRTTNTNPRVALEYTLLNV
jgi:hypothetical protein